MVYYFSSDKYHPMVNKILTETDMVCVGKQVGENIFLKKIIKENITAFEHVDILILDMTALADTEEEIKQSIESLHIMDYNIRFIIISPYKSEGDKFLRECFYMGIYDIITTDEYLAMSEQLRHSLIQGMRYKDALRYRDAIQEEETQTTSKVIQKILIGISGSGPRRGSTHNSIVLANFLREHKQMVAVMEMNTSGAFAKICEEKKAKVFEEGYFSLQGIDFFPSCSIERLMAVAGKLYNFLILDFGNYYTTDKLYFNKCDVRMIFSGVKSWETEPLEDIFREQDEDVLQRYHFCFPGTTSRKVQNEIVESMKPLQNIWFPEYTENPFDSSRFSEAVDILRDYLKPEHQDSNKKRKWMFPGKLIK